MEVEVKIFKLFLYNTTSGWMYMLTSNYFLPGDFVTDGEKTYEIRRDFEVFEYSPFHPAIPFHKEEGGYWVYAFTEKIPDCEGKILKRIK